jgi:hypothetical protein
MIASTELQVHLLKDFHMTAHDWICQLNERSFLDPSSLPCFQGILLMSFQ